MLTQAQGEVFESRSTTEDCGSDWAKLLVRDVKVLVVRIFHFAFVVTGIAYYFLNRGIMVTIALSYS